MFEVPIVPVVTKIFCAIRREHNCIISANESCVQERAVQWQRPAVFSAFTVSPHSGNWMQIPFPHYFSHQLGKHLMFCP